MLTRKAVKKLHRRHGGLWAHLRSLASPEGSWKLAVSMHYPPQIFADIRGAVLVNLSLRFGHGSGKGIDKSVQVAIEILAGVYAKSQESE